MKLKHAFLFLATLLSACDRDTEYHVNPRLQEYVDSFYLEAEKHGFVFDRENLIVDLKYALSEDGRVKGSTVRDVGIFSDHQVRIFIDQVFFKKSKHECIESVVFHEFGHALLRREHEGGMTLMNDLVCQTCYFFNENNRTKLIEELFK